jgi:hypothetical protein
MEIPYEVGCSLASSLYGIPRTTLDVDIARLKVADLLRQLLAGGKT